MIFGDTGSDWYNYKGLVSEDSVPVKLRTNRELDSDLLNQALDILTQYYKDKAVISRKLALAMVDIYGALSFQEGYFEDELLEEFKGISMSYRKRKLSFFLNDLFRTIS